MGRYERARRISTSAMTELHVAHDHAAAGAPVVIKSLLPHLVGDRDAVDQFLSEPWIAARLAHRNLVRIDDIVEGPDEYCFVMEHVRGCDLEELTAALDEAGGVLGLDSSIAIAIEVCEALAYVHEQVIDGAPVVHRDVAPANVIVSTDGVVKLGDFGRAAAAGTVGYMSPEQCMQGLQGAHEPEVDPRSDLFSLGVVLYELTTGSRLFWRAGESDAQIAERTVRGPIVAPRRIDRDYPEELEDIVLRALQREPARRYASAADMQRDLEVLLWARRPTAPPAMIGAVLSTVVPIIEGNLARKGRPLRHRPLRTTDELPAQIALVGARRPTAASAALVRRWRATERARSAEPRRGEPAGARGLRGDDARRAARGSVAPPVAGRSKLVVGGAIAGAVALAVAAWWGLRTPPPADLDLDDIADDTAPDPAPEPTPVPLPVPTAAPRLAPAAAVATAIRPAVAPAAPPVVSPPPEPDPVPLADPGNPAPIPVAPAAGGPGWFVLPAGSAAAVDGAAAHPVRKRPRAGRAKPGARPKPRISSRANSPRGGRSR